MYLWGFKPEVDHIPAMFQRILIVLWLSSFKWQNLEDWDSQRQLSVSIYESQVIMGKSGLSELKCPSPAAALLVLVLWWHCWGAQGISTAWPWLKEKIPSQVFKTKAITFLLTTFFVNKPSKGKGWSFLSWLVLNTTPGVGQLLAMLPSPQLPLDLPSNNPQCLLGMEGG